MESHSKKGITDAVPGLVIEAIPELPNHIEVRDSAVSAWKLCMSLDHAIKLGEWAKARKAENE